MWVTTIFISQVTTRSVIFGHIIVWLKDELYIEILFLKYEGILACKDGVKVGYRC